MFFNLIGSLGLFLLGMWLMTEGLKMAGGKALESMLGQWTHNKQRGLLSGIVITALVQSSSAVTVATLGFVNAGLMTFQRALWVVFGSNVGTTFTAWIVTFFGFSVKISAFAFPLVGIGAFLRLFSPVERGKYFGMALAGFGLLFMGIEALNTNFSGYADQMNIAAILSGSEYKLLWSFSLGLLLTVLTQSSSASIAIILTAVASGVAGAEIAAPAVIGANVGTTSTAIIASIGASANAKRLAWAHVVFNLLTAVVALSILPLFWWIVDYITQLTTHLSSQSPSSDASLLVMLAVFHTCFNLLGVLIMWPIEPKLSRWLLSLYASRNNGVNKNKVMMSKNLDLNAALIPDIAIRAISVELKTLIRKVRHLPLNPEKILTFDRITLSHLQAYFTEMNGFVSLSLKSELTAQQGKKLSAGLAISYYLQSAQSIYSEVNTLYLKLFTEQPGSVIRVHHWLMQLQHFKKGITTKEISALKLEFSNLLDEYPQVKQSIISAAVSEKESIVSTDLALQLASLSRRFAEQLLYAQQAYQALIEFGETNEEATELMSVSAMTMPKNSDLRYP